MAIVDDFSLAVPDASAASRRARDLRAGWAAFLGEIAAGGRAARDWDRLSVMSASQLRRLGLARSDIPQEIHRRHFADLGS